MKKTMQTYTSFWRYLLILWPLPLVFSLVQAVMRFTGNSAYAGFPYWISVIDLVLFCLVFGTAAFWIQRPLSAWGRHTDRQTLNHDMIADTIMVALPWRALKANMVAGAIYGTWLLALTLSMATMHGDLLTLRITLAMGLCFYFGTVGLASAIGSASTIYYVTLMRLKLSSLGGFTGNLEVEASTHKLPGSATRPWVVFCITGFLPSTLLAAFIMLAMGASSAPERHFIMSQALVLFTASILSGCYIVYTISRTLRLVTKALETGLDYLRRGQFEGRVPVLSDDDLGELSRGLNTALAGLEEREDIKDSLRIAAEIQQGLLLSTPPDVSGYVLSGFQQSCYSVGGDYYDYIMLPDGRMWLVIADVAGKGYPAALTVANLQAMLHVLAAKEIPFEEAVSYINKNLYKTLMGGRFVTMFMAKLQPESHSMLWVNAGHVPPLLMTSKGLKGLHASSPPMGLMEEVNLEVHRQELDTGDTLLAYTDGLTEARDDTGYDMFGEQRLTDWFKVHSTQPISKVQDKLLKMLDKFGSIAREDDLTILLLRRGDL